MSEFNAPFIQTNKPFDPTDYAPSAAPIFRRRFVIHKTGKAILQFCGLGYGYCYINGKAVSEDLFCAPVSDYGKLIWYNEYEVSDLLHDGENVISVILGNGFFNENFPTAWGHSKAYWRDNPRFALSLQIKGECVLQSDEQFVCTDNSFVTYNQLRSGETFDARLYDPAWKELEFDDSSFENAVLAEKNSAERRLCPCEPIREFEEYDFVSATETKDGYILDFGINMSGYVRICIDEEYGTEIVIRHAEELDKDGFLTINNMDEFYPTVDFQTDRYICGEKPISWSPKFTYHGFRFVSVSGLTKKIEKGQIKAIFVHQAVKKISDFQCSNELINKIYNAGIRATWSNMHYALTDCPTREKLGWINDAQASMEQIYINFEAKDFMEKWGTDMLFSMLDDGQIPAIIPSHGWGFGHGPVADGILFELPFIEYLYTGSPDKLIKFLPYLERYYNYYANEDRNRIGGLADWDGHANKFDDMLFVHLFYRIKLCSILMLAQELAGYTVSAKYKEDIFEAQAEIISRYIDEQGRCVYDNQTPIAMLLSLKISDSKPLTEQLKKQVEADNFHLTSGMLGLQYIFSALAENGAADYAYRLITSKGFPSYSFWFENDATTLWETWQKGEKGSRNHHMMSCVISSFFKMLLGISPNAENPGFEKVELNPQFIDDLTYCRGSIETVRGKISVKWSRKNNGVEYKVVLPEGIKANYREKELQTGENVFFVIQ